MKKRFKLNDYILIPINGEYKIKKISNEENVNHVSLYFVNFVCKNEIIYKWMPTKNEVCVFKYNYISEVFIDKFKEMGEYGFISQNSFQIETLCPCCRESEPFTTINEFSSCEPYFKE